MLFIDWYFINHAVVTLVSHVYLITHPWQVLSDNTLVNLVPGGADKFVEYEERTEYIQLVRNCRMCEGKTQV